MGRFRGMAHTEFDSSYFEQMARLEERHAWTRGMRELTYKLLGRHGGECILDAGCGAGYMLEEWRGRCGARRAVGMDFALPALRIAARRQGAEWVAGSADALPFAGELFDAVHCADVLQHMTVAGSRQALAEFARVLRPGGVVALRLRATWRLAELGADEDYSHAYTEARVRRELGEAGLEVVFARRVNWLGSLAAEVGNLIRGSKGPGGAEPVKGIVTRDGTDWRSMAMGAYLAMERFWLLRGLPSLGVGHTIVAVGRKPGGADA